jgi:hypothetical protein
MLYASLMSPIDMFVALGAAVFVWRCWRDSVPQND